MSPWYKRSCSSRLDLCESPVVPLTSHTAAAEKTERETCGAVVVVRLWEAGVTLGLENTR